MEIVSVVVLVALSGIAWSELRGMSVAPASARRPQSAPVRRRSAARRLTAWSSLLGPCASCP